MRQVEFGGVIHNFPSGLDDKRIGQALKSWHTELEEEKYAGVQDPSGHDTSYSNTTITPRTFGGDMTPVKLQAPEQQFANIIAEIETGGLTDRYIRTKVPNSASSAYGTYQITRGLLQGTLKNTPNLFDTEERAAAEELVERQSIALAIGGSDRVKYGKGGAQYGKAVKWAKQYGYDSVDDFLKAFDYGGDLGLSQDGDFLMAYENIAHKLLRKHLADAGGDAKKAAAVWHGGPNWRNAKSAPGTNAYLRRYDSLLASGKFNV